MKRFRIRIRLKVFPVLWCAIILASIYLLVKFAAISFSDDIGQAGFIDSVITRLCSKVLESGPSLVSYTAKEEDNGNTTFLMNVVEDRFALQNFITDTSVATAKAEDYNSIFHDLGTGTDSEAAEADNGDAEIGDAEINAAASNGEEAGGAKEAMSTGGPINLFEIDSDYLSKEYIMTNGAVLRSMATGELIWDEDVTDQLQVGYLNGNITPEAEIGAISNENDETAVEAVSTGTIDFTMEQLKDVNFLVKNFYTVNRATKVTDDLFDAEKLLGEDMTLKQGNDKPQILIYHTHSQEAYADSRPGVEEDTVVGMGAYFAQILSDKYGYNVIHDTTYYDVIGAKNGISGYNFSYSEALAGITKDLEENPSIEVVIDIHRDSGNANIVTLGGEETAQIMMFNGLCRDLNGPLEDYYNPYLQDNLAFSLQLQMKGRELYPGLFIKNYLRSYRYNMHVRQKCILVEMGTVGNSIESVKNALEPFANVLDSVLKGEKAEIN